MVSNDERRKIAEELRSLARGSMPLNFFDVLAEKLGFDGLFDGEDVYRKLAELIDRPTCEALYIRHGCHDEYCDREHADIVQCGNCGGKLQWAFIDNGTKLGVYDANNFCPTCGAEVERCS